MSAGSKNPAAHWDPQSPSLLRDLVRAHFGDAVAVAKDWETELSLLDRKASLLNVRPLPHISGNVGGQTGRQFFGALKTRTAIKI